jgi:hypothetical protein
VTLAAKRPQLILAARQIGACPGWLLKSGARMIFNEDDQLRAGRRLRAMLLTRGASRIGRAPSFRLDGLLERQYD